MEQGQAGTIGFREVDLDGNPVIEDSHAAAESSGPGGVLAINPFIGALWLLTILLIGGGAWVFLNANSIMGPSPSEGMPVSFLAFTFAPYAIFAGLIALVGLLFWHAQQWRRRHGQATREIKPQGGPTCQPLLRGPLVCRAPRADLPGD